MYVKLDLFSGRPNPAWRLDSATARRLSDQMAGRAVAPPAEEPANGLGFRGIVVQQEPGDPPVPPDLPLRFRIAPSGLGDRLATLDAPDLVAQLLESGASAIDRGTLELAMFSAEDNSARRAKAARPTTAGRRSKRNAPVTSAEDGAAGAMDLAGSAKAMTALAATDEVVLSRYAPAFWNSPVILLHNNCYNFATNQATNTVAQPGRRAGQMYSGFTLAEIRDAAFADGYRADIHGPCRAVALAIWPGFDFHWWRLHPSGMWAHKLGLSTARNFDNLGNILAGGLTPENCDRHPYTEFAGFFFAPLGTRVI
jgi:hypothetical protein